MTNANIHPSLTKFIVDIEDLRYDGSNARTHDKKNIEAIKSSLSAFGQRTPIVVQRENKIVRAGNGRLEAAQELGWDQIAAVFVDDDNVTATAYAIADNRTGELAQWDEDALQDLLKNLDDDLRIGWDEMDLEKFDLDIELGEDREAMPPDMLDDPDAVKPATMKPGQTFIAGNAKLVCGDCIDTLKKIEDNSIDSIVTDPPYGIGFMGKNWDCNIPSDQWSQECLRVLKPGGHIIAFAATRTIHRLTTSLEDSGFEIRDMISWIQWQGFPKSLDVSKAIDDKHGATREVVGKTDSSYGYQKSGERWTKDHFITTPATDEAKQWQGWGTGLKPAQEPAVMARKPLEGTVAENVLKWNTGSINVDGCRIAHGDPSWPGPGDGDVSTARYPANIYHCIKAPTAEREDGCESLTVDKWTDGRKAKADHPKLRAETKRQNHHPTVKPINLMRWLVRLVTPPNGVVLDTFVGSGTTSVAAVREDIKSIGIELDPAYAGIAKARIKHATKQEQSEKQTLNTKTSL